MRCDKSMRRSKERCYAPLGNKWKCSGDCKDCPCCLHTKSDGTEEHTRLWRGHSQGTKGEE